MSARPQRVAARAQHAARSVVVALVLIATVAPTPGQAQARGGGRERPLPLESARRARFTATEGTWMSLDVSPDGSRIVFDLLGDLYLMPAAGGKATRLTSGMAFDAQPRFSPDGTLVVFVSDRSGGENVWIAHVDLTDTIQVTRGDNSVWVSPEWTPDGKHVVVSRSSGVRNPADLVMVDVELRTPLPLVTRPNSRKSLGAALSPDGRWIWYAARSGDWEYNTRFPNYRLYRYDRETGQSSVMSNRYGSAFRPAISPDGNWLVYGTREGAETGLRKRDLRTGEESWLAHPVQRDDQESRAPLDVLPGYAFTPGSDAVIVSYGGGIWRVPLAGGGASAIPFSADVDVEIGPEVRFAYAVDTAATVTARQIRNPVAAPDGRWIAFTAFDRLWVKELPDGPARRLTAAEVGEFHPQWSPDGQWLAFVTWDDAVGGHIMKVRADGLAAPVPLTRAPALYTNVAWTPDGQRVVATRGAARELREVAGMFGSPLGGEFVWVPAAGGEVTVIAPTGTRDVPHFRTDQPHRIYAYSPDEGLVSFRWDGTDVKQHVRVRGSGGQNGRGMHEELVALPRRPFPVRPDVLVDSADPEAELDSGPSNAGIVLISPIGDRALAQVGSDLYTLELPRTGQLTTVSVTNAQSAPVQVRRLTEVGGEFPSWTADGGAVHWAMGNVLFSYDLSRVEQLEDSTRVDEHERALVRVRVRTLLDSLRVARDAADAAALGGAVPDSLAQRLNRLRADSVQAAADILMARADSMRAEAEAIAARADSVRAGDDPALADTATSYRPVERRIEVTMARDVPAGSVVLRGGRALTMRGREIVEDADVVVTGNRIVAVGKRGEVTVPEGAHVVDVTGKTVTPGFVDTHYHAQWLVPEIHPEQVWQYLATLAYGVTTTRDPQSAWTDVLSYRDRVETGGMIGPRVYSSGPGVFAGENLRDAEHAATVLKRYAEYYDTETLKMYLTGNRQQRQWIIKAARELRLMPTTEGGLDFKTELTHAMDGYSGVEHALPVAPIFSDVVKLFRASQTTSTPTLLVSYGGPFGENWFYARENVHDDPKVRRFVPEENLDARARRRGTGAGGSPGPAGWFLEEEYVFPRHAAFARRMIEDSARVAVGSHGQLQGLGYHWELWAIGSGGMAPHDVLRAATVLGAEAIGLGADLGTLEAGKLADVLVMDGDPLTDLRDTNSLRYVMKNGRLYDAETLDEAWPRTRPLPSSAGQASPPTGPLAGLGVVPGG